MSKTTVEAVTSTPTHTPKSKGKSNRILGFSKPDFVFYVLLVAWPLLQFCVFYIGVNFKSIVMSFENIEFISGVRNASFTFDNVKYAFLQLTQDKDMLHTELMSVTVYLISLVVGVPLGLLFSYYIFKKKLGSGLFRVLLFLPSIVSAIIMVTMYKELVNNAYPEVLSKWFGIKSDGLLANPDTKFFAIAFYNVFVSFGTSVLMYSNRMSAIEPELVEAGHLDGATGIREFWHIVFPQVFPTATTFLIVGVAGIFNNQFNLFSFYGPNASNDLQTFGYYLYNQTRAARNEAAYPIISALGMLLSIVAIALTFAVRALLTHVGPSED